MTMTKQQGVLGLLGVCLFVILMSLAGLASDFITHLLGNIDGLLLFAICLMMVGLFALMLFQLAKEAGWLPSRASKDAEPAPAPKPVAAKPVASVATGSGQATTEGHQEGK